MYKFPNSRHEHSPRQSAKVSSGKYVKIVAVVLLFAALMIFINLLVHIIGVKKSVISVQADKQGKNAFSDVSFNFQDVRGREISLRSDKITEEKKNNFTLDNLNTSFLLSSGEKGNVHADKTFVTCGDENISELQGNVQLSLASGMLLKTEHAFVNFDKKISYGDKGISIFKLALKVSAKKYYFDMDNGHLVMETNVRGFMKLDEISSDMLTVYFEKDAISSSKSVKKTEPETFIKYFELKGNALFNSHKYNLRAGEITYSDGKIEASKNVFLVYKKNDKRYDIRSGRIRVILGKNNDVNCIYAARSLRIKEGDTIISADGGVFKNDKIQMSGNVIISGVKGDLFGEKAELDIKTGDISIRKSCGIIEKKDKR